MSRFIRNTVILAKIETTYGTDAVPAGADDAILVSNPSFTLNTNNVKRDLVRPFFGASEELVGTRFVENGFEVELVGSGTAGVAPGWGKLVRACAMDEVVEADERVDYVPLTDGQESLSLYTYRSGVRHKALGARGKLSISMKQGEIPKLRFSMVGLYGGIAAATPSGVDFSEFQTPQVVTNANTTVLRLGATVNPTGAPVITGGTAYPSLGIDLDFGLEVPMTALIGAETVDVTDRQLSGKLTIDLSAADEATLEASVLANALTSLAFLHGTVAGKRVLVYLPSVQLTNPQDEDLNGRLLKSYDLTMPPSSAGNDEIRLICY